jgi:hypothetical protein
VIFVYLATTFIAIKLILDIVQFVSFKVKLSKLLRENKELFMRELVRGMLNDEITKSGKANMQELKRNTCG